MSSGILDMPVKISFYVCDMYKEKMLLSMIYVHISNWQPFFNIICICNLEMAADYPQHKTTLSELGILTQSISIGPIYDQCTYNVISIHLVLEQSMTLN